MAGWYEEQSVEQEQNVAFDLQRGHIAKHNRTLAKLIDPEVLGSAEYEGLVS